MANLKEIRNRIQSVGSTMQITNAMKMVSAAKLKRAQDAITDMLPYAKEINELIQKITASSDVDTRSPYSIARPVEKVLLVAITSNKGLCGGFNSNIIKETIAQTKVYKGKKVGIVTIGKKANDILSKSHQVDFSDNAIFDNLNFIKTEQIANQLMTYYVEGNYDRIVLVYNHFINAGTQQVIVEPYLPISPKSEKEDQTISADYLFEPTKAKIIESLIPKALKIQLFKAFRDSFASEHGARMTAMHKATDNAGELKSQLTLTYNKARQAAITAEILEIVGGAEALNA